MATLETIANTGVTKVTLTVHGVRDILPGQYVYLAVPGLEFLDAIQFHPLWVAWSKPEAGEETNSKSQVISLLIKEKRGVTKRLYKAALNSEEKIPSGDGQYLLTITKRIMITGPYGHQSLLGFQNAIFVAEGIGVASQLLQLRELVEKTATIVNVFWILEPGIYLFSHLCKKPLLTVFHRNP